VHLARVAAPACALLVLGSLLAGCGEKSEPSAAELRAEHSRIAKEQRFDITGDWRGELKQQGLQPFTVEATIDSLQSSQGNVVRYSGIDCSGHWSFQRRDGEAYVFEERTDRGEGGQCKGSGTVTLTPVGDDRLDYEFRGDGVTSRGTLARRR
jgi:hypothetical protein